MTTSIEVTKKFAAILNNTVGYLLDDSGEEDALKDPDMLKWLNETEKMDSEDKGHSLHLLDGFIKSVKLKNIAAL